MEKRTPALLISIFLTMAACTDSAADRSVGATSAVTTPKASATAANTPPPFGGEEVAGGRFGIAQATTGGRASGHFELAEPFFPIREEQYSFVALSTGNFPSAKGQLEAKITRPTNFQDLHADVDCLIVIGNEAWMSGPITRLIVNGVAQEPNGRQVAWRVRDMGEGANSQPDLGSVLFVGFPQACVVYYFSGEELPMTPTANGNIQVSQK